MTIGVCALALMVLSGAQDAVWKATMDRAESADNAGNYAAAIESYRAAVKLAEQFGANDLRTWSSYNRLGMAYLNGGLTAESIRNFRQAASLIQHAAGKQNTAYTVAIGNLGTALVSEGDSLAGENMLREALEVETGRAHTTPAQIAVTQIRLTEALLCRGRYTEAEHLLENALPVVRKAEDRFYLAVALNAMAVVRHHQRRDADALDLAREALALTEENYGVNHPVLVRPLTNLAVLYTILGNFGEAGRTFLRAQAISDATLPANHPSRVALLTSYAEYLRRSGEKSRAKEVRQQASALAHESARRNGVGLIVDAAGFRQR